MKVMGMIKGTIWNIVTFVTGIKLLLLSSYNYDFLPQLNLKIIGAILLIVSVWFLLSRVVLGPTA